MRRYAPPAVRSWFAMGAATSAATVAAQAAARDGVAGTFPLKPNDHENSSTHHYFSAASEPVDECRD